MAQADQRSLAVRTKTNALMRQNCIHNVTPIVLNVCDVHLKKVHIL